MVVIVMLVLNLFGFSVIVSRSAPSDIATVVDTISGAAMGSVVLLVVLLAAVYTAVIGGPSRFDKMLRPVIGLSLGIDLVANSIGMANASMLEGLVEPSFSSTFTAASYYAVGVDSVGALLGLTGAGIYASPRGMQEGPCTGSTTNVVVLMSSILERKPMHRSVFTNPVFKYCDTY
jgi:hypothetical protein